MQFIPAPGRLRRGRQRRRVKDPHNVYDAARSAGSTSARGANLRDPQPRPGGSCATTTRWTTSPRCCGGCSRTATRGDTARPRRRGAASGRRQRNVEQDNDPGPLPPGHLEDSARIRWPAGQASGPSRQAAATAPSPTSAPTTKLPAPSPTKSSPPGAHRRSRIHHNRTRHGPVEHTPTPTPSGSPTATPTPTPTVTPTGRNRDADRDSDRHPDATPTATPSAPQTCPTPVPTPTPTPTRPRRLAVIRRAPSPPLPPARRPGAQRRAVPGAEQRAVPSAERRAVPGAQPARSGKSDVLTDALRVR
jgi:hypothetical protein